MEGSELTDGVESLTRKIEALTREADQLLSEVVRCRKTFPELIAEMRSLEDREKIARICHAPLMEITWQGVDVEKVKKDIVTKIDKYLKSLNEKETLERDLEQLELERTVLESRYNSLLKSLTDSRFAPIDALPIEFLP